MSGSLRQQPSGAPVAAFEFVRTQGVIYATSIFTGSNPMNSTPPALELKVAGSLVFRRFHLAVVPKAWRPTANTPFTIDVEFITNNQPLSRLQFHYGQDPTTVWPAQGFVPLSSQIMGLMPPFVCLRQTNYQQYAELIDPLDLPRLTAPTVSMDPDSLQWPLHDSTSARDGATLIITTPLKLVSDCDLIRVRITPDSLPWAQQTDGYTDGQIGANFHVCVACFSNSINPG